MKHIILVLFAVTAIFNLFLILKGLLYNKVFYRSRHMPLFDRNYRPRVGVFVPCKGMEDNLETYLAAFLSQQYPNYTVTYITESGEDPAVEAIKKVAATSPLARHIVSGRTEKSCQKTHNLLKAISLDNDSEVFIFADADVKPATHWISDLVLPLSRDDIPASTGFRWLTPPRFTVPGTLHSMMSAYICVLMTFSKGVWGGSMAIRRRDFERFGVAEFWGRTVVDDITLTQILIRNSLKRVFVPHCIAVSGNVLPTFKDNVEWFSRQLMFLKLYCPPLWLSALIVYTLMGLLVAAAFYYAGAFFFFQGDALMGWASLAFITLFMLSMGLVRFNYNDGQSFAAWVALSLLGIVVGVISFYLSACRQDMIWRNIRYTFTPDGTVKTVEFL